MAETTARTRPSRKADSDPTPAETPAQEKPKRQTRTRKPAAAKLPVYFEHSDGTLQPLGEYKAHKPEDAVEAYVNALEGDDRQTAIEAATYAVETTKGLIRVTVEQKITVTRR